MTLAGKVYAEKKAAGTELLTLCQNMLTPEPMQIGLYRGLTLELSFDSFSQEYRLAMIGQLRHVVTLGTDVFGNIQRMDNLLESLPVKEQACREKLSELHSQLKTAKAEVLKPFPREEELKAKLLRLEELSVSRRSWRMQKHRRLVSSRRQEKQRIWKGRSIWSIRRAGFIWSRSENLIS